MSSTGLLAAVAVYSSCESTLDIVFRPEYSRNMNRDSLQNAGHTWMLNFTPWGLRPKLIF